jgi:hypothetical protein
MTVLLSPTAVRALLLAAVLACAAALMAPAARGAVDSPVETPAAVAPQPCGPILALADDFSWSEFIRYWANKAGTLQGVVGTVVIVAATAVLIILSKGRWG